MMPSIWRSLGAATVLFTSLAVSMPAAFAGPSWDSIRAEAFGGRETVDGTGVIALTAPYRPEDVRRVPLEADVTMPEGRTIKSVSFIVDENPSPVAAVFKMGTERAKLHLGTVIRLNQQSDVRVVVEANDGTLYMSERLVKFAGGQASCSAPPVGDLNEIAANMGKMTLTPTGPKATASHAVQKAHYELNHPNHTGMVLDPISLLYIPLLMVEKIEAKQGDETVFEMTGSITLAQNPSVDFDFVTNGATDMTVTVKDTNGSVFTKSFEVMPQS